MAYKEILYEKEGNLGIITINRPQAMNSLTNLTLKEMTEAVEDTNRDRAVRALIVTGTGDRAFSAGMDFGHLQRISRGEETIASPHIGGEDGGGGFYRKLYELEKPTLAAINGVVAVGSFGVMFACDIRIASDKARFAFGSFLKRALTPHNGTSWWLPRLVGEGRALELFLRSDIMGAEEALKLGLVSRVVPHNELMAATKEYANQIASGPPITIALTKREIHRAFFTTLPLHIEYEGVNNNLCHGTEDFQEAVRAFQEKREPVFKGQ